MRKHKLEHWDRHKESNRAWLGLNMMTEGRAGFRAFHEGSKACRGADFLLLRRRLARVRSGRNPWLMKSSRGRMARSVEKPKAPRIRALAATDLSEVARIDGLHTACVSAPTGAGAVERFRKAGRPGRADRPRPGSTRGPRRDLLGESRRLRIRIGARGWIFADLGVDPGSERQGVASQLLAEAAARFKAQGVPRIRTMVRRNEVPVLAFFRSNGFRGGPFVQLELDIEEVS